MSKFEKPKYTGRALENELLNNIISSHDLCCGCEKPLIHINNLLKCRLSEEETTTTETGGPTKTEEIDIDAEDLERLFAENPGEG